MMKIYRYFFYFALIGSFIVTTTGCSQKRNILKKQGATQYTSVARHRATMRAYQVLGKNYSPRFVEKGQIMNGVASWYGPNFHGKYTSNGEIYNMHAKTAAHKTWPMDTMVKVTNLENGKRTTVRINDRGPFVSGRIIDCSYTAGRDIGLDRMGIAKVSIEVIGFAGRIKKFKRLENIKITSHKELKNIGEFGIQIGSFLNIDGAKITKKLYANRYKPYYTVIKPFFNEEGNKLYRVWVMGFSSEEEAKNFKKNNHVNSTLIESKG